MWADIEALYSPKFGRWMPHINLLWPFVSQNHFEEGTKLLLNNPKFQRLSPFLIRLDKFAFNDNSKYLFLVPEIVSADGANEDPAKKSKKKEKKKAAAVVGETNPIITLRNILLDCFPDTLVDNSKLNYEPHLSIGQFDQQKIAEVKETTQRQWKTMAFEVSEIQFITREGPNDKWKIHSTLQFHAGLEGGGA